MASPYIVGDLGGSPSIATYCASLFALGNAIGIPLGKPLARRFGTVRLLLTSLCLFIIFSIACPLAPNYPCFNLFRFLQGLFSGGFYMTVFHLFRSLESPEKRPLYITLSAMTFIMGPVLGACFGGWIAYEWDWRWSFYLEIPFLIFLTCFLYERLRGFDEHTQRTPFVFDRIGYSAYAIGFFCVGLAVITGQEMDWFRSPLICTLFAIGIPAILFFIFWELYEPSPFINFSMLKNPLITFALFNLGVLFFIYFGTITLLALWLKLWANYTPDWIAALFGIMALSGLLPLTLLHPKIAKWDNRIFLVIGILCLLVSSLHTMIFSVDIDLKRIALSRLSAGLG